MKSTVAVAALALLAAGCSGGKEEAKPLPAPISLGPQGGPGAASGMPAGHPAMPSNPHEGMDTGGAAGGAPEAKVADDRFQAPEGWQSEKPSSGMRVAQFRLPRADGDAADGEVAVFGSPMGDTKANIDRWRGQFAEVSAGKDKLEEITEGLKGKLSMLDITGNYSGGMGAMGAPHAGGDAAVATRMIGAIYESPSSTFYIKVLGPPNTVAKWEKSIREFILAAAKK